MKKLSSLLLCLVVLISINAQGILNSDYYGFEIGGESFQMQAADYFSIVHDVESDVAAVGDSCLKFTASEELAASKKIQGKINVEEGQFAYEAGAYVVSIMVYKTSGSAISSVNTNYAPMEGDDFLAITWNVSNIAENQWVKLTQTLQLPAADSTISKFNFQLNKSQGPGTLYLDDFNVQKDVYEMDTIAGNYLNTYYYGFESGTENENGIYIPGTSKAYVTFATEKNTMQTSDKYAIKFDIPSLMTLPRYEKKGILKTNSFSIQIGENDTLNGTGSAIVPTGDYTASIAVFIEERNISTFTTPLNDNTVTPKNEMDEWFNLVWTIPENIKLNEWVTLTQKVTLTMDYDTKVTLKADQKDLVDTTKNAVIYFDNLAFVDYKEDTVPVGHGYKEGNVLDESFMGFERSGDVADGWYPQKNSGDGYFSFSNDKAASGDYSLLMTIPAGDNSVPSKLKVQATISEGNTVALDGGIYDLYLKVFIEENSEIKAFNTNFSKDDVGDFKAVQWDLTNVKKGEWVELHRIDTLPAYTESKIVFQTTKDSLDNSTNTVKMYMDNFAAIYKGAFQASPTFNIIAPMADSVFASSNVTISFIAKSFVVGTDGKMSYTLDGETAILHDDESNIVLTGLDNGAHQVILTLVDSSGAMLTPVVTDTINFTVEMPSGMAAFSTINMNMYPNPAQGFINLETEIGSQITIYNLLGAIAKTAVQISNVTTLDISELTAGSYIVCTAHRSGTAVTKLQVK